MSRVVHCSMRRVSARLRSTSFFMLPIATSASHVVRSESVDCSRGLMRLLLISPNMSANNEGRLRTLMRRNTDRLSFGESCSSPDELSDTGSRGVELSGLVSRFRSRIRDSMVPSGKWKILVEKSLISCLSFTWNERFIATLIMTVNHRFKSPRNEAG